jgi:hypothetical protein
MTEGWYDGALICRNGHVVERMLCSDGGHKAAFCTICGLETLSICPECGGSIRGAYLTLEFDPVCLEANDEAPAFCHACGKPYPWTATRLAAAQEMARELDSLDSEERELLASSLAEIMADTSRTQLAASRTKRLLAKAGPPGNALYRFVTDFGAKVAAEIIMSQT